MTMRIPPRGSRGHTLLEIFLAIALVAVLAALVFPATKRFREASNRATCASNMRQITGVALHYAQDHNGTMPYTRWGGTPDLHVRWMTEIAPYLNSSLPEEMMNQASAVMRCPQGAAYKAYGRSPTYFGWDYVDYAPVGLYAESESEIDVPVRLSKIDRPASVVWLVEANNAGHAVLWPGWTWDTVMKTVVNGTPPPVSRHSGGMNMAFLDGHVEWVRNPTWNDLGMFQTPP